MVAKPPKPPPLNLNVATLSWTAAKLLKNIDSGERGGVTSKLHWCCVDIFLCLLATYYVFNR